jgi:hypothetical protein
MSDELWMTGRVAAGFEGVRLVGHGRLGGNAAWADPTRGQAIAYVTRRLGDFAAVERIEAALAAAES